MPKNSAERDLPVIEVPAELRGPSDEEILAMEGRVDSAQRRRAARRPSKKERLAAKMQKERAQMVRIGQMVETEPKRKEYSEPAVRPAGNAYKSVFKKDFHEPSSARKKLEALFDKPVEEKKPVVLPKVEPVMPVMPKSGRVLKGSFGANLSEKPKTVIVSAADLLKQRMEERAKKVRAALFAKKNPGAAVDGENPPEAPVKRGRGRPRKIVQ